MGFLCMRARFGDIFVNIFADIGANVPSIISANVSAHSGAIAYPFAPIADSVHMR